MIIFIDNDGSENVIRNDQIAIDLFKSGTITPNTMVKTDTFPGDPGPFYGSQHMVRTH